MTTRLARLAMVTVVALLCLTTITSAADSEKSGGLKSITFDDIKLDLKKDEPFKRDVHLTEKVAKLDKQRVVIRGWILPGFQQSGITQFVLVRDNKECCFGPGAALYDCILVEMESGKSTHHKG